MKTIKNNYVTPVTELINTTAEQIMIQIGSGDTSPEESDANRNFFDEYEEFEVTSNKSLWDD